MESLSPPASASKCSPMKLGKGWTYFLIGIMLMMLALGDGFLLANNAVDAGRPIWSLVPMMGITFIPLLLMGVLIGASFRQNERARISARYEERLDQLQNRLGYREDLLRLIADNQDGAIAVFDRHNRYWFVNRRTADRVGATVEDIISKPPLKVLGNDAAKRLELRLAEARASGRPQTYMDKVVDADGNIRFIQSHYTAITPFAELSDGVLVSEEDLTTLIVERERRERMLHQVIDTLVAVVDRRDPYASGHSARVGQLARAVSEEMGLDARHADAAEIAGSLMNFGKVLVSRSVLTKTSPLTPEELQRVRDSILTSADILSIIGFDGPVVPTLRQVLERYDGTGVPQGLSGDAIMLTARIVAVANAFVAMVSPRAHREGMPFREALQRMMADGGSIYDQRVLLALNNYVENRPNKLDWLMAAR